MIGCLFAVVADMSGHVVRYIHRRRSAGITYRMAFIVSYQHVSCEAILRLATTHTSK
jgi:hypothetical protein